MENMTEAIGWREPSSISPIPNSLIPGRFFADWGVKAADKSYPELEIEDSSDFDMYLAGKPLPPMTQANLAKRTIGARKVAKFNPEDISHYGGANAQLNHATFDAVVRAHEEHPEEFENTIKFLKGAIRGYLITLSRTRYTPKGQLDQAIHDFGMPTQYSIEANLVGPDRWTEQADSEAVRAVLGNGNIGEVNDVYQGINDTNMYIVRWNSKPLNVEDRVVWLDAGSDGASLDCGRHPEDSDSSLGLVVRKAQRQK